MAARRILRATLCAAAVAVAWVGVASASATYLTTSGTPDYAAGTIPLVVVADLDTTEVSFELRPAGEPTRTVDAVRGPGGTFSYNLRLTSTTRVVATAVEGDGEVCTMSADLSVAGREPGVPVLAAKSNQLVRADTHLKGSGAKRAATMTVQSRRRGHVWVSRWTGSVTVRDDGTFELPEADLPSGASALRLVARNAFGSEVGPAVHVHNLGAVPSHKKLVLIDKSSRWVYVIVDGRVKTNVRCAIGMPWTPTPTGTFRLGKRHRPPNSYWGPWRLRFWRKTTTRSGATRLVSTHYFIHGTSVPSSIGHMKSHGCVRLYNKDIRRLSTIIDGYTAVIRE